MPSFPPTPQPCTLIAQRHARSGPAAVGGELHEEVAPGAEQPLDGQVLHLVGVVHWRRLHVVAIADDEPAEAWQRQGAVLAMANSTHP